MAHADGDGDGVIDYEEFLAATISQARLAQREVLLEVFRAIDRDGSGTISTEELDQVRGARGAGGGCGSAAVRCVCVCHMAANVLPAPPLMLIAAALATQALHRLRLVQPGALAHLASDDVADVMAEADTNGDGFIDFEEFCRALSPEY
jgi:Ca2+-binding EF-hand superfamily protein